MVSMDFGPKRNVLDFKPLLEEGENVIELGRIAKVIDLYKKGVVFCSMGGRNPPSSMATICDRLSCCMKKSMEGKVLVTNQPHIGKVRDGPLKGRGEGVGLLDEDRREGPGF